MWEKFVLVYLVVSVIITLYLIEEQLKKVQTGSTSRSIHV